MEMFHYALVANKAKIDKGSVFWYKSKNNIYGAIVLDVLGDISKYYLIALSEKIENKAINENIILSSLLYTVAWFADIDLLPNRRVHLCGSINIGGDYNNRAGLELREKIIINNNCGQQQTWKHLFRSFCLPNVNLKYVLEPSNLPKIIK